MFVRAVRRDAAAAKERSSWLTHHPQIGIVPRPHAYEPDLYGPGVYLRTNAQGFRNRQDFSPSVAPGRLRLICSGDSYTFGRGVANDQTWCELLSAIDPALETANLGMSGYGFDTAYLRYRHQGDPLDHDIHLFAFITDDLYRMRERWRWSWEKPVLTVRDGKLILPDRIPCAACAHPYLAALLVSISELRTTELLRVIGRRLGLGAPVDVEREIAELTGHIVSDLAGAAAAKHGTLALVHLPVIQDYGADNARRWRERLSEIAAREGATYVDLIAPFRHLPADSVSTMFLPKYIDRGRHYTAAGHAWVADRLYRALEARLDTARRQTRLLPRPAVDRTR